VTDSNNHKKSNQTNIKEEISNTLNRKLEKALSFKQFMF